MLRVLHLADNPYTGGIASHILSVHDAFVARGGVEVEVGVFPGRRTDESLYEALRERQVTTFRLRELDRISGTEDIYSTLNRLVRTRKYDLVHVHDYRANIVAEWSNLSMPIIATSHGQVVAPALRTRLWQFMHLRLMRKRPAVIAVSDHVARWLESTGVPPEKIHVVHNAVTPPADATSLSRSDFGAKEHDTIFLYVGRLVPGKGLENLIDAAARLDDAVLVLVGDGPLRESLEARAAAGAVRAKFTGFQPDPWPYYKAVDCVVLPSQMEALPMSLIEAASVGLPAIATRVGGIPEVVEDETSGVLIPPNDREALVDALDRMCDSTRRARYSAGAKQIYDRRFTPDRLASALYSVYAHVR